MIEIETLDGIRELNIADLVHGFEDEVTNFHPDDIDAAEWELLNAQYAYVKFGLILDKIRSQNWWERCRERFADFKSFCHQKTHLSIWQVANAIKSARVAVKLNWLGFSQLPRNASQALKLAELSLERLGEVWGNVVASCAGHKITALAIERQINPDQQSIVSTLRLPTAVVEAFQRQAIDRGLTLNQYLEQLALGEPEQSDRPVAPDTNEILITPEAIAIVDRLEQQWIEPSSPLKVAATVSDRFDSLMTDLIGKFIPPVDRLIPKT